FATTVEAACSGSSPIWTTTPDQASVTTCVGNAVDGDTINVLSGSATWSNLTISNKSISLIGAGAGNTTISGGILFTIITKATGGAPAGFFRLSGFQFMSTGGCRGGTDGGAWSFVGGTSANVRLDHNAWIGNVSCPMLQINSNPGDNIFGVADH